MVNLLGIFKIGFQELLAQAVFEPEIFLISASWLARITGVSHQCPAIRFLKYF
jgi:hypothetical protein